MWMKDVRPPTKVETVSADAHESSATLSAQDTARVIALLGTPPPEYTSDDIEADLSIAVNLLMDTLPYLWVLRDMNKHQDFMQEKTEEDFKEHLETVEEFTGQWS